MHPKPFRIAACMSPTNAPRPGGSSKSSSTRMRGAGTARIVFQKTARARKGSPANRRLAAAKAGRGRIAYHRRGVLKHAPNAGIGEARVPQPDVKRFDRVCDHARVELAKGIKLFFGQQRCDGHAHILSDAVFTFSEAEYFAALPNGDLLVCRFERRIGKPLRWNRKF